LIFRIELLKKEYKAPQTSFRGNHLWLTLAQIDQKLAVALTEGEQQIQSRLADFGVFSHRE
jgi:hypothetical protein